MPKKHSPGGCHCCGGGTGIVIAGCACTSSPSTLHMSVSSPDQTPPNDTLRACTFVWGPTPACLTPLAIGGNSYLSTSTFVDSNGDTYYYYYNCFVSTYAVFRVYCVSIFGSPYMEVFRYKWPIGSAPNQCSGPYLMHTGTLYAGGNPACVVHIDP